MTDTLFKEVHYSLGGLIGDIGLGRIGLPDIQRPFAWGNAKVRAFLDALRSCGSDAVRLERATLAGSAA
jgi:uncharacterized protein with ParB-like and HNH nuclease domain